MKKAIIRILGLKGSWKWAKRQMLKGEMVRCKHWSGALKFRIDNKENQRLECCLWEENKPPFNGTQLWNTSNHFLSYEDFTDYEIFKWE